AKYRTKEEVQEYKDVDPVKIVEMKLIKEFEAEEEVKKIKELIKNEIEEAVQFAEESEYPDPSELYTDNYVEPDYPFIRD
ncbi:MAG: pyruvate dehydrogenase (acetyl-transferring) E1 component subunit alpha, partial [Saprospiraceae bacterium]|nr:pyruvate dehydrogenase (acetyl-transferring) E1 component subunit alpha [Saprospiraceae bacterium]